MKRLFTFGCSFTGFHWPTWADILGKEFDYYENWGTLGAGNQYIFNSLVECKTRHQFTSNDTIIIMWTNVAREDRYIDRHWVTPGNILTQNFYNKDYVEKIFCERGFLIRDLATIAAAIDLLKSWNVKFEFLSMVPISNIDQYHNNNSNNTEDILSLYKDIFQFIKPSVYETVFKFDWWSRSSKFFSLSAIESKNKTTEFYSWLNSNKHNFRPDPHPTPEEHLEYLNKVLPNYTISDSTNTWIKGYQLGDEFDKHFPDRL